MHDESHTYSLLTPINCPRVNLCSMRQMIRMTTGTRFISLGTVEINFLIIKQTSVCRMLCCFYMISWLTYKCLCMQLLFWDSGNQCNSCSWEDCALLQSSLRGHNFTDNSTGYKHFSCCECFEGGWSEGNYFWHIRF